MCLAQGPQRSDAGEARTHGPSVSSQALYHWATALPSTGHEILIAHKKLKLWKIKIFVVLKTQMLYSSC